MATTDCQTKAKVQNGKAILLKVSTPGVGCTNITNNRQKICDSKDPTIAVTFVLHLCFKINSRNSRKLNFTSHKQLDADGYTSTSTSSSSVVSHAFSAPCVYSKFGHHPHPLGYLCAKLCFFCGLHCWASPWRKIVYSITQSPSLFDALQTEASE